MQCNDAEILTLGEEALILSGLFFSGSASFEPEYLMTWTVMVNHSIEFCLLKWDYFYRSQRFNLEWTNIDTVNHVHLYNGHLTKVNS